MLVALANAQVTSASAVTRQDSPSKPHSATPDQGDDMFAKWQLALLCGGFQPPDQYQVPALAGSLTVAGLYKSTRTAVVLATPSAAQVAALLDKGYKVLDMADPSKWAAQFHQYAETFGAVR